MEPYYRENEFNEEMYRQNIFLPNWFWWLFPTNRPPFPQPGPWQPYPPRPPFPQPGPWQPHPPRPPFPQPGPWQPQPPRPPRPRYEEDSTY